MSKTHSTYALVSMAELPADMSVNLRGSWMSHICCILLVDWHVAQRSREGAYKPQSCLVLSGTTSLMYNIGSQLYSDRSSAWTSKRGGYFILGKIEMCGMERVPAVMATLFTRKAS